MAITNVSKPSSSMANVTKINTGETWASITKTWATEIRTWAAMASLLTNTTKQSSSITNVARPA